MATLAYAHDGVNEYDFLFLDYLTRHFRVHLLTFHPNPSFVPSKTLVVKMPRIFSAPTKKAEGPYMYALFVLRAIILRFYLNLIKPRLVFGCMATKYGFYTAISRFRPYILIVWGSDILLAPRRFFLFRFMASYAIRKADAVIVDSDVQRETVIQLGCSPEKIMQFPWFNSEDIRVRVSRDELRNKLGWRENPIIICTRKHESFYGVEYLIDAIPEVIRATPEARFLIVGGGTLTPTLKARVKQLGVEEYLKFTGYLPRVDVMTNLNASDVYVSTSLSDGTSASLLEAMTLGIPSVVTDIPGNTEWIKDGWNGYLVPVKDSMILAEKIILLTRNRKLGKRAGENAHKTVADRVDWHKTMESFSNLIMKLTETAAHDQTHRCKHGK